MRQAYAAPPAKAVDECCCEQIDKELRHKIDSRKHSQLFDADVEIALDNHLKQWKQIIDRRLHNQPIVAGNACGNIGYHEFANLRIRPIMPAG